MKNSVDGHDSRVSGKIALAIHQINMRNFEKKKIIYNQPVYFKFILPHRGITEITSHYNVN